VFVPAPAGECGRPRVFVPAPFSPVKVVFFVGIQHVTINTIGFEAIDGSFV
jgi:hypothetical protein